MDKIEILDNKLRELNSYELVMNKYVRNFCIVAMMVFMFFATSMPKDSMMIWMAIALMLKTIVDMKINPYLYIYKDKVRVPIYTSLKETSISKKDFVNSRLKYYFRFISKIFVTAVAISLIGGLITKEITFSSAMTSIGFIILSVTLVSIYTVIYINLMTKD